MRNYLSMLNIKDADDLKRIIASRECVIYGAGYVAQRFFKTLRRQGLGERIKAYVTSSNTVTSVEGFPVISLDGLKKYSNPLVLIAVHEAIVSQIEIALQKKGYREYIWIYPFLYEVMLGKPYISDVSLTTIWRASKDSIVLPARYLAIEQYYGKNDYGYEIYKKSIKLLDSADDVVEKRLREFLKLIINWEKKGYDENKPVKILGNGLIVDGAHRISLALYHRLSNVKCEIYPETVPYKEIHNPAAIPLIANIHLLKFTQSEQNALEEKNKYLSYIYY